MTVLDKSGYYKAQFVELKINSEEAFEINEKAEILEYEITMDGTMKIWYLELV